MMGRRIVELERIYGIEHGNNQHKRTANSLRSRNQEDIAEMMGMTRQALHNYKALLNMIPYRNRRSPARSSLRSYRRVGENRISLQVSPHIGKILYIYGNRPF